MIHVYIADDHSLVRSGLRMLMQEESDMVVVGEAGDGWTALRRLEEPDPDIDVLLLDLSMPLLGGFEVMRRALKLRPGLRVLVVSMYPAEHWTRQLREAGAAGYLSKNDSETDLLTAVRTVARGETYFSAPPVDRDAPPVGAPHLQLTGRELQVFLLVVSGRSVMDVAAALNLGQSTVSTHMARIRTKLSVDTVAAMVTYAHREGLIQ